VGFNPEGVAMDLAPLVRAVEVLMSPLEWGSREAWLAESLRRVREACGAAERDLAADGVRELEALLRLPNDEPGWLGAALESPDAGRWGAGPWPAVPDGSGTLVQVVSLRCALHAGLATLHGLRVWRGTPGQAFDDVETRLAMLPTTQELRATFGLRGREPQIALLAAKGLSNAAIAQRLRLSAHTVRHYLERVLDRLGLHTRKALALHLMAGGGERPEPPGRSS
jgi:DNA-binding CsgD family transcriptional regulator